MCNAYVRAERAVDCLENALADANAAASCFRVLEDCFDETCTLDKAVYKTGGYEYFYKTTAGSFSRMVDGAINEAGLQDKALFRVRLAIAAAAKAAYHLARIGPDDPSYDCRVKASVAVRFLEEGLGAALKASKDFEALANGEGCNV
jgi:hypothetical protein